ncbi:uncharacterized protein TRUGW13939_10696 [Talaromyces rugulosus]|uniref:BHLH domain-containing protein n=1 Tax=Talaromyces rugulosus TaxID=121627 RepID=A0A7H8RDB6_TALRU|nr:uncharacterized protein TRUGW13939_10696 [Talaromyces rugulosus]QKX63525.1 hypothetical protein TRUGW13939_10696 [Talaromyces rugulosus]
MTCYQPPSDPFDLTRPMVIPAGGRIADSIDPSDLMSTFPSSDADWMGKSSLEFLPWDLSGSNDQQEAFNLSEEVADGLEFPNPYINGDYTSPMGYRGYTVATEDALSYASPVSDGESGTWSPTHNNDKSNSQSPAPADNTKGPGSATSPSTGHRHAVRMPLATAGGSPVAPAEHTVYESSSSASLRSRKLSNATASSSSPLSLTAATTTTTTTQTSYHSNTPPVRSATEPDPAAVMKRKKAAHNAIEKRYRTNMNAKFLALGNSIPRPGPFATQLASNKGSRKHSLCSSRRDSLANGTQQQQQQQNKSEILTNALSYIQELQEENSRLKGELMVLKENLLPRGPFTWRR